MLFTYRPFLANMSNLTTFTSPLVLDLSYWSTTNISSWPISIYVIKLWFLHQQCELWKLVCNDCQCQKPLTVHLTMRSAVQTHAQPSQQHTCPLCWMIIEVYVLAASAMWTIMPPSASSSEQGACPSMSLGCRKMTSLSRV